MVNVTSPASSTPSSSVDVATVVGFSQNTTQYLYASPSGTIDNVHARVPAFVGVARLSVTLGAGSATWTGLEAGLDSQHMILRNTDPTNTLTLSTGGTGLGDTGSFPANRFYGQNDYRLPPGGQVLMVYYTGSPLGWSIG